MANSSRTQDRTAASRFGRTAGKGQSAGKGAPTGRSLRARSSEPGAKGRFGLGSALSPSARPGVSGRSVRPKTKVTPKKSGVGRALTSLTGGKSGAGAARRASTNAAKPAGFALLAGAAGLALKNRDKLSGLMGRGGSSRADAPSGTVYGDGTATGIQVGAGTPASAVGTTDGQVPGSDTVSSPTIDQTQPD